MDLDKRLEELLTTSIDRLSIDASAETRERLTASLEKIAAIMALEWIAGDKRTDNLSQQTEYWLSILYEEVFSDEQPDPSHIYTRFELPLPKSQYLTRLLIARRQSHWRAQAKEEVIAALQSISDDAQLAQAEERADTQRFDLSLSKGAYDELSVMYDAMAGALTGARPAPPQKSHLPQSWCGFRSLPKQLLRLSLQSKVSPNGQYQSPLSRQFVSNSSKPGRHLLLSSTEPMAP